MKSCFINDILLVDEIPSDAEAEARLPPPLRNEAFPEEDKTSESVGSASDIGTCRQSFHQACHWNTLFFFM